MYLKKSKGLTIWNEELSFIILKLFLAYITIFTPSNQIVSEQYGVIIVIHKAQNMSSADTCFDARKLFFHKGTSYQNNPIE